uniref:Mitochondrial inner membrane protein MPV17 n=1 Tax=Gopherus agassizii TaxID=38772 RepID=A0A452H6T1_9SAUR
MAALWRSYQRLMAQHPWRVQILTAGGQQLWPVAAVPSLPAPHPLFLPRAPQARPELSAQPGEGSTHSGLGAVRG